MPCADSQMMSAWIEHIIGWRFIFILYFFFSIFVFGLWLSQMQTWSLVTVFNWAPHTHKYLAICLARQFFHHKNSKARRTVHREKTEAFDKEEEQQQHRVLRTHSDTHRKQRRRREQRYSGITPAIRCRRRVRRALFLNIIETGNRNVVLFPRDQIFWRTTTTTTRVVYVVLSILTRSWTMITHAIMITDPPRIFWKRCRRSWNLRREIPAYRANWTSTST